MRAHITLLMMILAALAPAGARANPDTLTDFIGGGSLVAPEDPVYTSTVLIQIGSEFCSGTLISADLIVTAAHCMTQGPSQTTPAPLASVRVSFPGSTDPDGTVRFVSGFEVNPTWIQRSTQEKDRADIAVIRVVGYIPPIYRPADTWPGTVPLQAGSEVILAGFGEVQALDSESTAGVLRKASVAVQDPDFDQTEVMLDQSQGAGACYGDSGGPAFLESDGMDYFWGVASRGDSDCTRRVFYTRVAAYWDWLKQAATRLGAKSP
jgi:secreted trypsin-like serine protease